MTANIQRIGTEDKQEGIIEVLEYFLEQAKEGKLQAITIASIDHFTNVEAYWRGTISFTLLGIHTTLGVAMARKLDE